MGVLILFVIPFCKIVKIIDDKCQEFLIFFFCFMTIRFTLQTEHSSGLFFINSYKP